MSCATRAITYFIDCGPIGLAGRGGHGHNDALSFEAWLEGAPLVIDRGSFVYTGSFEKRNEFRSTASHNTPSVDGEEINRFDPAIYGICRTMRKPNARRLTSPTMAAVSRASVPAMPAVVPGDGRAPSRLRTTKAS